MRISIAILISILALLIPQVIYAQTQVFHRNCVFQSPNDGQYVETHIIAPVSGLELKYNDDGTVTAEIYIQLVFIKDDTIKAVDKYSLSKTYASTQEARASSLVDIERFQLEDGLYLLNGEFVDANANESALPITFSEAIVIGKDNVNAYFSDVMLIENYTESTKEIRITKNGLDIVPYVTNYYPTQAEKLTFYTELYNTDKAYDKSFLVRYQIEDYNGNLVKSYSSFQKKMPNAVNTILASFDITDLHSGNYNLVIEALNQHKDLIAKKEMFFFRLNKNITNYENADSLTIADSYAGEYDLKTMQMYTHSLLPIASNIEKNTIDGLKKSTDLYTLQKYFTSFWYKRNSLEPEQEWLKYKAEVDEVENNYATTIEHGFETDRGRLRLTFGEPDVTFRNKESDSHAYEVWHYYQLDESQTNIKFLFYNPTMVPNQMTLLHSNAIGEAQDPNWKSSIYESFRTISSTGSADGSIIERRFGKF